MPQPTRGDVHVNKPLTNLSIAYIQKPNDFIADKAFPIVPVMKQSDRYFSYTKDYWFRTGSQKRAPGAESAGGGFAIDNTPNYFCDVWAFHKDVDDQTRANADEPINLDRDATRFVTQNHLLRKEIIFKSQYMKTGVWGTDYTPSTLWSASGSDPVRDIDVKKSLVKSTTAYVPNVMIVTDDVLQILKSNASILDRIKYTQRGLVTEELLASLFGVEKFLVASAVLNSAKEGQTASMDFLMKNMGLLVYAAPAPSILEPSGGYTFSWQGLFGAGAAGNRIKSFRMEHLASDRIEGEMAFDMKLVGSDLGVFINAPIA